MKQTPDNKFCLNDCKFGDKIDLVLFFPCLIFQA